MKKYKIVFLKNYLKYRKDSVIEMDSDVIQIRTSAGNRIYKLTLLESKGIIRLIKNNPTKL